MTYFQGFLIPVPEANRDAFVELATGMDALFEEFGALRTVECWGVDLPEGKRTDYRRAVAAEPGETVAFSWTWWPDKAAHDAAHVRMRDDPRMRTTADPMPFDGKRMVYAGFDVAHDTGEHDRAIGYVDGIVAQLPPEREGELKPFLERTAAFLVAHGALRVVDGVGDSIVAGNVTDFRRAVDAGPDALIVFGWIEWPDRATRDAAFGAMMQDAGMTDPPPWDGPTGIFGGFTPILDTARN